MTEPHGPADEHAPAAGSTPGAPDVDQPDGGDGYSGRTPSTPDNDQPDGGDDG